MKKAVPNTGRCARAWTPSWEAGVETMVITELYIKNFGKFSERHFYFHDGVQVVSGENEFGKTTLHAFIRAMLFGLERGRGRAAAKDEYSRYEPWENPGHYAGVMRFVCGGRHFRLERSFSRLVKRATLVCEDDGEELSVEHGDLDMLLGGMTPELFDSTVSVGQMKAEPGQELFRALENYAANYFETGGGEYDLSAALRSLKDKRKALSKELEQEEAELEAEREKLRQECRYLERDMERLRGEYEERQSELEREDSEAGQEDSSAGLTEQTAGKRAGSLMLGGAAGIGVGALGFLWSRVISRLTGGLALSASAAPVEIIACLAGAAGLVLLIAGLLMRRRGAAGRSGKREADQASGRTAADPQERARRLGWEMERIRSEWKDKELRRDNLREQYGEMEESAGTVRLKERIRAVALAEEELEKAARATGESMERRAGRRASEIFTEITGGRSLSLAPDGTKEIAVWDGSRRIPARALSRGTLEQIYFAVRMAAAEILLEEPMPVILDDVFAFYDDKRLESVLKWLSGQ
ncbi:MAG TPA: AAA family ATPase, partial [Candidatus Mediterraneibacter colneyensis]|nr:AAA family ATPase [Candidatus Mediterraneibacter colneyensis]